MVAGALAATIAIVAHNINNWYNNICSGGGGGIIAWLYHGITNIRSGSLLLLGIARIKPDYGIDDNI
jgi:hypothetical protein